MVLLKSLNTEDLEYTTVLVHSTQPICFLGTTKGSVEAWDLQKLERIAIMRHMQLDEYGDPIPIEEPVVTLAAPYNFDVVYALFGTAAYCIDVGLLTIIQEVPITEQVISGSIGQYTGDIGVITISGYLSRWSAKFVERTGSIDFPQQLHQGYLLHDYDEGRMILVLPNDKIVLVKLDEEPYTIDFVLQGASEFLKNITYDCNDSFQVNINNQGTVDIYDNENDLKIPNLFAGGKIEAENKIRDFITTQDTSENARNYIKDFRLLRQSRDRYTAEVEKLSDDTHYSSSINEDSKTVFYALNETVRDDLGKKTTGYQVIDKLSGKYQIDPRYVFFARKHVEEPEKILEVARYFEFEASRRAQLIKKYLYSLTILIFIQLLLSSMLDFGNSPILLVFYGLLVISSLILIQLWRNTNSRPHIPGITTFTLIRTLLTIGLLISLVLLGMNSFRNVLPLPTP